MMPPGPKSINETRPSVYQGVFPCEFYDGIVPMSPILFIILSVLVMFLSCCTCTLGQKMSAILEVQDRDKTESMATYDRYLLHEGRSLNSQAQ